MLQFSEKIKAKQNWIHSCHIILTSLKPTFIRLKYTYSWGNKFKLYFLFEKEKVEKQYMYYRIPDLQFDLFAIYSDHPRAEFHTCIDTITEDGWITLSK